MRVALSWSTGKDSALTLHELISQHHEVVSLFTTLTEGYHRVTMHGVRRELLQAQARSLGLDLLEVWIPPNAPNEVYEERMSQAVSRLVTEYGVEAIAFGDIWLEDVRRYREQKMSGTGVELLFPIWGRDPLDLVRRFLELGYRAVICVVDGSQTDPSKILGSDLSLELVSSHAIDAAGERGEYHTFVYDGPLFKFPVRFSLGHRVVRDDRFHYVDLVPAI
ncbi:MAG: adenine nucleotide alpha hydrolase [Aigarchaeota archaeon]|nr:adenine nucleotide alpha hydrolase [Aigarchaeota archaeon]MDW8093285.1 ATP-binding protein [Nitrososphaerota archaeon]